MKRLTVLALMLLALLAPVAGLTSIAHAGDSYPSGEGPTEAP